MAVAIRIIPQILCSGRKLIKGKQYDSWRPVGVAQQAARIHQARAVDELMLIDIMATKEDRSPDLEMIERLADVCFSPLSVGGGVRSLQDIRDLLNNGADKVVIGTAAVDDEKFIADAVDKFGSSTIVVSIDYKNGAVYKGCGKQQTDITPMELATRMQEIGVGELVLNSIDREGAMIGYDTGAIKEISSAVRMPVIASCGCGTYTHMAEAIDAGASAVAAGSMFQFTDRTPRGAAEFLYMKGYEARV